MGPSACKGFGVGITSISSSRPASPWTLTRLWALRPVAVPHKRSQDQDEMEGSGGAGVCALAAAGGEVVGLDQLETGAGLPPGGGVGEPATGCWSRHARQRAGAADRCPLRGPLRRPEAVLMEK